MFSEYLCTNKNNKRNPNDFCNYSIKGESKTKLNWTTFVSHCMMSEFLKLKWSMKKQECEPENSPAALLDTLPPLGYENPIIL